MCHYFLTCNIWANQLFHHIQESFVGPEVLKASREVAQLVHHDRSAFELLLQQNESLVKTCLFTLVLNLSTFVELISQEIYTIIHSLCTERSCAISNKF